MADWDDVRRIVSSLPETHEEQRKTGQLSWRVKDKSLAWERPLRKGDLAALGDAAPDGDILGVRVPDLVELDKVDVGELEELIVEAWLCRAPKRLRDQWSRPAG